MSRLKKGAAATALAVALVGGFEGLRLYSYQDVVGVWTACYGETKGMRAGMRFTRAQCDSMLASSLAEHERGMRACLSNPDSLPDKVYVADLSLGYNIGTGRSAGRAL
jgi:lysozyme